MGTNDSAGLDQSWARSLPARVAREIVLRGVLGPLMSRYSRLRVTGLQQLGDVDGPVIFVANHCSHVDTPVLLRALPGRWRRRTAVAAAADYFYTRPLLAKAVSLAFGTVPLERRAGIDADPAAIMRELVDGRWSLVVYAEGTRSRDGRVGPLRSGAALLAAQFGVPIVPVHIAGTHAAMPPGRHWMLHREGAGPHARHTLWVSVGAPIHVGPRDDRFEAMERVRMFMETCGAQTTPDPKLLARRAAAAAKAAQAHPV